ncbi:stage IV sporulation protein FB [Bacillus benzoevorans]|uniref:Stage IV sporulation protein FB n=2 Tax=Bacillus benzoevorans TaxID=1456 RepID=A0A7X0HUF8_9BACI|nr:M50 family metallopeptidase [Bacillus benzoevorans]MBB6445880.1 stage IV sporulation protein FB [Bacillus benzoevorans]
MKAFQLLSYIRIHPLLWLMIALAIVTGHFIDLSLFLMIVMIHELGHAVAASFLSWRIKRISLLPFGGVAEMDEHGNRPIKEEAIVILAGPLQHIWLMGLSFLLFQFSWIPAELYQKFIEFNIMVLIFNLLPIWPLDGGKLIYLWRCLKEPFPLAHRSTMAISAIGLLLFTLLVIALQPFNLNMWVIIAFLSFSLYFEWKQSRFVFVRFLLERYYGKKIDFQVLKQIHVSEDESILRVLQKFQRGYKHLIIIEKDDNESVQLDENEILHAYFTEKMLSAKIGELLYPY